MPNEAPTWEDTVEAPTWDSTKESTPRWEDTVPDDFSSRLNFGAATEQPPAESPFSAESAAVETAKPSLSAKEEPSFLSKAKDYARELISPIIGPTEAETFRDAIPWQDESGKTTFQYKPLGSRIEQAGLVPAMFEPKDVPWRLPNIPQQEGAIKELGAAAYNLAADFANSLTTSPGGLLTLGVGAELHTMTKTIGEAQKIAQSVTRIGAGGFAADMARGLPEQFEHAWESINDPDATLQEQTQAVGQPLMTLALVGALTKTALTPNKLITELKAVAPETAKATVETLKGETDAKPLKADATTTDQVGAEVSATKVLESTKAAEEITSEPIPGEQKLPSTSPAAEAPVAGDASPPSTVKPSETPPMAEPTITGETPSAEVKPPAAKPAEPPATTVKGEGEVASPRQASMDFDKLVLEHAAQAGWARNPEALYAATEGNGQQGTASIQGRILKSKEMKIARRNAAIDAGLSKAEIEALDTPAGRAAALEQLREHIEGNYGEHVPKLRPGEKKTGELFQGEDQPFNLKQETGLDAERIAADKAKAVKDAVEAKAIADREQMSIDDWTSATSEQPFTEPGMELSSGIAIPKFGNRKMSPLDRVTTTHSGKLQKSFDEARRAQREIRKAIPSPKRREAVSVYREANGDMAVLKDWETNAKQKWMKDAARDAQTLTPEEIAIVDKAKTAFEVLEKRGNNFDVLKSHRDNYIPHVWNIKKPGHGSGTSMLKERFRFSKARTLNTFFEGDQAGMKKPNLDLANLLPAYIHEMNTVIADRQMVRDIVKGQMPDGSPMAVEKGNVSTVEGDSGKAVLVKPKSAREADTSDYRVMADQPALSNWIWEGKDTSGKPVFVKADLGLHPDVLRRVNAMIGQSALRTWYHDPVSGAAQIPRAIVRGLDTAQAVMKREMFGLLAPFHQVQEGTHGIGHMVNPFFGLEKIDLRKPNQIDAANHGLMLLPDRASSRVYLEGVGTQTSLLSRGIRKVPKVGEAISDVIDGYQDYLFHQYIPALKLKTYEAMLGRNTKLYAEELKSGEMTEADIKITSAEQANAAYGHLNYALLDRNPTIQHIIQLGALAPDFLEARTRFAGQAVKGLSSKVGHEQLKAIAILAAAQAGSAFILSNLLGTDYDPKHPFEVIYNGRRYFLRSVPEDIYAFLKDRRQFIAGRVNPLIVKGGIQLLEGVNYRGEKVDTLETFTELLAGYIPLTARSLPGVRSLTETSRNNPISPLQQLAGSFGLRISRYSPISETYKNASAWMEGKKLPKDRGSYPISKYQQLRYALEDGDLDRAKGEYEELKKTMTPSKISSGFRSSINHPFTGSIASDREFAASLKGYDKELYDHAIATRKNILNAFGKIGGGGSLSLDLLPK